MTAESVSEGPVIKKRTRKKNGAHIKHYDTRTIRSGEAHSIIVELGQVRCRYAYVGLRNLAACVACVVFPDDRRSAWELFSGK